MSGWILHRKYIQGDGTCHLQRKRDSTACLSRTSQRYHHIKYETELLSVSCYRKIYCFKLLGRLRIKFFVDTFADYLGQEKTHLHAHPSARVAKQCNTMERIKRRKYVFSLSLDCIRMPLYISNIADIMPLLILSTSLQVRLFEDSIAERA